MKPAFFRLRAHFLIAFFGLTGFAAGLSANPSWAEDGAKSASGQFSMSDLPADRDGAAILTTPAPGRYSVRARSASGARIEIIDMIEGPGESSGAPGQRDGRIDRLLDKGAYKIHVANVKGATGKVHLSAEAFTEVDAKRPALVAGRIESGELGDMQQRSYGLEVGAEGRVAIEAVGRALQDMRLWSSSGDLVDLAFDKRIVQPKPGHFMTRIGLEGALAPGRYLVTAYGAPPLVWSDSAAAQPFMLRLQTSSSMDAGFTDGVIGPFGSARFAAPGGYTAFRLELPQPAKASLDVRRDKGANAFAQLGVNNREPAITVFAPGDDKEPAQIEVSGFEGQAFTLRAARQNAHLNFEASGPHLVGVDLAGDGGDEVPASVLFAQVEKDGKIRVLASDMPRIATGRPWRGKFNLRGRTTLLFEAKDSGPVAVDAKGVKLHVSIEPTLGALAPRADGKDSTRFDLQAGFYTLVLEPQGDAAGVIDVTLGTPGVAAPAPATAPERMAISFGQQQLELSGSYHIIGNIAPQLLMGPRIVALPAEVATAPLPLWQRANEKLAIPLRAPKNGKIVARDSKGADVALSLSPESIQNEIPVVTATIAPVGKDRALALVFVSAPPPAVQSEASPAPEKEKPGAPRKPAAGRTSLSAMQAHPIFFDLGSDETQELRFNVAQGGLYRAETLGRLQTAVKIGAAISTNLASGENNGPGHNGLATTYLRAGAYRAAVTAKESSGHLGFSVTPATLVTTPKLGDQGSVRTTLPPGKGAVVPIEIAQDGVYRIDLLGVGRHWRARLEDSEGWPLTRPGELTRLTRKFEKGSYRLVVTPEDVEARLVARLRMSPAPLELSGHGPHPLPFETAQKLQWREPQTPAGAREPDVWNFTLRGDSEVTLMISDGMIGEILRGEKESMGKAAEGHDFKGKLAAGDYRVEARALSRDDRRDYEISLSSTQLQPGAPRLVDLPATLSFEVARDAVVDISSFGDKATLGVLKDAGGATVESLTGGSDDWNVSLSRRLPAGAYSLELTALGATPQSAADSQDNSSEEESSDSDSQDKSVAETDNSEQSGVELRLALPEESDEGALAATGAKTLSGLRAHLLALPAAREGSLMLVSAQSSAEVALSIERQDADGTWRVVGSRRGLAPVAAWPAPNDKSAWRIVAWAVGGREALINIIARVVERRARNGSGLALEPIEGAPAPVCAGLTRLSTASVVEIGSPPAGLAVGSAPGQLLKNAQGGALAPQSELLWFVAPGDCKDDVAVKSIEWRGEEIALDLGAGESAEVPALEAPKGKARLWLARSTLGDAGLDAGHGMAVSAHATLALAGDKPVRIWEASGGRPTRVALRAIDVDVAPLAQGGALYHTVLPPLTAQPVALAVGDAPLELQLPTEVAAFSSPQEDPGLAIYGGASSTSATYHGALKKGATLWLVNLSNASAPVSAAVARGARETLTANHALKRFFGAGGEIVVPVSNSGDARLFVIGGEARFLSQDGRVSRSANAIGAQKNLAILEIQGPGVLLFDHPPGLSALWLESIGKEQKPQASKSISTPQRVTLAGDSASFALHQTAPTLLTVSGGAPAIVAFTQNGQRDLDAFPAGVEFRRYMAAGDATLDVYSAAEGPLSGALDVFTAPVIAAREGVNDAVTLAPGAAAIFAFEIQRESEIGLGLRAEPDRAEMRLLNGDGKQLGEGVEQSHKLAAGHYLVEARIPANAPLSVVRLAILGLSPPLARPPDEVVAEYLDQAGLKKAKAR
jgi:hypothetical protein